MMIMVFFSRVPTFDPPSQRVCWAEIVKMIKEVSGDC
jgi:hypothetical protein